MKKYIFLGFIAFLLTILLTIPASIASKLLPRHIEANSFNGNIWEGSATSFTIDQVNLGSLKWKIKPGCFLALKLCADIEQSNHEMSSDFSLQLRKKTVLENLRASGSAHVLNSLLDRHGITLAGDFQIDLEKLSIDNNRIQTIDGDVQFTSLSVNGVLRVLLGDLKSVFEPQDAHTLVRISNQQGHIDLLGNAQLFHDMSYELDMNIKQNNQSSEAVVNGMQFIGDQQADGSRRILHNGKLVI